MCNSRKMIIEVDGIERIDFFRIGRIAFIGDTARLFVAKCKIQY